MRKSSRIRKYASLPLRYSLAGRILSGFLLMAFFSLLVALAGIYYTNQASNKLVNSFEADQQFTGTILEMQRSAERQNSSVRAVINNTGDERAQKELVVAINDYERADQDLKNLLKANTLPPELYNQVQSYYINYRDLIRYIRTLLVEGPERATIFLWENTGESSGPYQKDQLIKALNAVLVAFQQKNKLLIDEARNQSLTVTLVALLLVTVAGILGAFVTSLITRSITRPLRKLAGVARAIRQGDLDVNVPVMRGEDEVANLAGAMASMAENLRISRQELQDSLNEITRRNRELSAVNRVAASIGQSLDLEVVLHDALNQLMAVSEMEYGSIFLVEPDNQTLRLAAYYNQTDAYIHNYNRLKIGEQMTGQVAQTGEVMMLTSPIEDERITHPVLKAESHKQFYLGVPFKSKGKVVGVANLTSQHLRKLEDQDMELLKAIGNQIGIAVDNARLYQQASQVAAMDERNRLARDLHDSVTQTLFSITLTAESARAMLTRRPEKVETQLERLQNLARGALAEMRSLIFQLRPAALQEQGLIAALEKHIAFLRSKEAFEIDFVIEGERRLSDEHEQALYRIAQEAFNNIIKHAQATRVSVKLVIDEQGATLTIRDNGQGFNAAEILNKRDRSSLGLISMRERTELAGGTYKIESEPGKGTFVCVSLPLGIAPLPVGMGVNKN